MDDRAKDFAQRRMGPWAEAHGFQLGLILEMGAMCAESGFYFVDYRFGFLDPSVNNEPSGDFPEPCP